MDRRLLDALLCPRCEGALELAEASYATVEYSGGPREEVQSGMVACGCGLRYPIADFVLSLAGVFSPELQQEAAYWDRYYMWLLEQGSYGFHDLRLGLAPYITMGITEPFPAAATIERYDVHQKVAEHPLVRKGTDLLDMGVGLGWTSLHFARAGYNVTAFEPSLGPVTAAKRYAIEQGIFVEYICGALGHIKFGPAGFDNVTAFHSLHHVPNLETALREVRTWLRLGGALAIDEHVGNSRLARALAQKVHAWAEAEVFPQYRTLGPEALSALPGEPHSALEDSGVDRVVPLVGALFEVREATPRHVFLDHYPLLYYLHTGRDLTAFRHALDIANQMQDFVSQVDPDGADYVTIIAENTGVERVALNAEPPTTDSDYVEPTGQDTPDKLGELRNRVRTLERELAEQGAWAKGLERELRRKDDEIGALRASVHRLESGRVMRLLNLLKRRK